MTAGGRDDHIRAERAEFLSELAFDVEIEIQQRGNYGRAAHHGNQRDSQTAAISAQQLPTAGDRTSFASQNRRRLEMRGAAQWNQAAEQSLRCAQAPVPRETESFAARPAFRIRFVPTLARARSRANNPIAPPIMASSNCSARKIPATSEFVAPIAFMTPISARRSRTVVAEVAATAKAAATKRRESHDP